MAKVKAMIPALALLGALFLAPSVEANDRYGRHGNRGYYSHGYSRGYSHGRGYYHSRPYYYSTPYPRYYRPYSPYYYSPYYYSPYGYAPAPYGYGYGYYPAPVPYRPGVHVGIGLAFGF